ncbi:MAG TPA: hypothetical protein DCE42_00815 [Myxococcales bacterium]|nr:hypothetical protein [Deltaproteobacteria bacterium]HAA53261.1 hypothetical protein [Myxococcales bacterium]|tara:strand:+ start:29860 stop:30960 length:1101 start_codon:yes stop_codon:yes gene_type:complete
MKKVLFGILAAAIGWGGVSTQAHAVNVKLVKRFSKSHCQHPKWSKDGRFIAYEVRHTRKRVIELRILDIETSKTKVVRPSSLKVKGFRLGGLSSKSGMVSRELAWSPKGNKFLFSSNGSGSVYNVFQSNEGRLKINSRSKNDGQPAWSANGKRVVFTSARSGKGDLYTYHVKRMKAKRLTKYTDSTEFFPVWSPASNKRLAYVRHTDQEDRIYVINNVFTKRSKRLTKWKKNVLELNPSWSPDGQRIAFFTVTSDGVYDLAVSDLSGNVRILATNVIKSDQYGPAWSPNGKHIFYVQKKSRNRDEIRAVHVKSRNVKRFKTGTKLNNELSVVARDGNWMLAFTSQGRSSSSGQIYRKLYLLTTKPF